MSDSSSSSSGQQQRDEVVGHATLAVLALLGMGLYSTTYALLYASTSTRAVATLEFFMATTHLLSASGCCLIQTLVVSILQLRAPVRFVPQAQTALFLGVAGAMCTLGGSCLGSATGAECAVYFGAAAVPRLAAVGAVVWSILLYASSLGCQPWTGGGASSALFCLALRAKHFANTLLLEQDSRWACTGARASPPRRRWGSCRGRSRARSPACAATRGACTSAAACRSSRTPT